MTGTEIALGIALLVMAVAITLLVLFQSGKDKRLSGAISGAGETFFGKSKSAGADKKMALVTGIVAVVFTVLVLVMYCVVGNF